MTKQKPDLTWLQRIINMIFGKPYVEEYKESKHIGRARASFSESKLRKIRQNRKKKRKIAYQSKRINRIRAKS